MRVRGDAGAHRGSRIILMPLVLILGALTAQVGAQVPERNVNVLGGPTFLIYDPENGSVEIAGDPWRNQQVEPFCDISSRNPAVIVCGAVDFRLVDLPGGADGVHHDSWNMVAQSPDGGTTWSSTLHPGHPLDPEPNVLSKYDFAADPIVRAGAAGVFYQTGLAADRPTGVPNPEGAIYVSTWIHLNDREDDPAPVKQVRGGVTEVVTGNAGQFRDRPHFAVGEPTGETCTFEVDVTRYDDDGNKTVETVSQTVPATPAYLAFTTFVGQEINTRSKMHFTKSDDCGRTWGPVLKISEGYAINQAPQIVKFPGSPRILVFWRLGQRPNEPDAIVVARSEDEGQTFSKPRVLAEICPFDQLTSATAFRTKTVPSGAADGNLAYVVWADRRDASGSCTSTIGDVTRLNDARIVMMTTADGEEATSHGPFPVDPHPGPGHQLIGNVAVSAGQVHVAWLDFRSDASGLFEEFVDELPIVTGEGERSRHTADMRATEAPAEAVPAFPPSQQISQYIHGIPKPEGDLEFPPQQLQWNVVNTRNFDRMRVVFNGDYNVIAAESLVPKNPLQPSADGQVDWVVNGQLGSPSLSPVFHRFWTDSRNMMLVPDEIYSEPRRYTPPDLSQAIDPDLADPLPPTSLYDPTQTRLECDPDASGTKNLEIYSSRSTHGFYAFAPWNNKTLLGPDDGTGELVPVQRAFPIVVQNTVPPALDVSGQPLQTEFVLTIAGPEPETCPPNAGGCVPEMASFQQFSVQSGGTTLPEQPTRSERVSIPAGSAIARTVYVTSVNPRTAVQVDVANEDTGEVRTVFLNPDPSAPPNLKKPGTDDGTRHRFDISRYEVHDLDISDVVVQDINVSGGQEVPLVADQGPEDGTPGWRNPGWRNPGWRNPGWRNPGWRNPGWRNPGWRNPGWRNPGWRNPGWRNPGILDGDAGGSRQIRATYTNTGNTTSSYDARVSLADPSAFDFQLIVYKLYATTPDDGCDWEVVGNTQVLVNVPDYDPTGQTPADTSFSLHPGETAYVVLVVTTGEPGLFPTGFNAGSVIFAGAPQALDTEEIEGLADGQYPPAPGQVSPPALSILTSSLPYAGPNVPYDTTLEATGGFGTYGWSVSPDLPTWATLDPVSGRISGTPDVTDVITTSHTFQVTDETVPPQVATQALNLVVQPIVVSGTVLWNDAPITDVTSVAPDFWVRENPGFLPVPTLVHYDTTTGAYSIPLPMPAPGVRYSIGPLFDVAPPFNNEKGFAGDYDGWVSNYDVSGGGTTFTQDIDCQQIIHLTSPADSSQDVGTYPVWESYPSPVTFTWESVPDTDRYDLFIQAVEGTGWGSPMWPPVYEDTVTGPPLSRTVPLAANDHYRATIYAYNGVGTQIGRTFVSYTNGWGGFRFQVPGPMFITTSSLPDGSTVLPYGPTTLDANGTWPYTWSWSGDLPPGLNLDPSSGIISGTPTLSGTYSVLVEVRDGSIPQNVASKAFSIRVFEHAITGTLFWNELPLFHETDQPAALWAVDTSSDEVFESGLYDPSDGTYSMPVPAGTYDLRPYIDAVLPFDGRRFPGDYTCYEPSVVVGPDPTTSADINCATLIHLTSPFDNSGDFPWAYIGSHTSPVAFRWDAIPEAEDYRVRVELWADGGTSEILPTPINQTVVDPEYDATLDPSDSAEHYESYVWAYNLNGVLIGEQRVVYVSGYGGDYRFKVVP